MGGLDIGVFLEAGRFPRGLFLGGELAGGGYHSNGRTALSACTAMRLAFTRVHSGEAAITATSGQNLGTYRWDLR